MTSLRAVAAVAAAGAPVADAVTGVLAGVQAASPIKGLGRDAAGMPGTVDADTAAGYAGYTPDLAAAVAMGDTRGAARHRLNDVTIGGRHYARVSGTTIPGPIWRDAMKAALDGVAPASFTKPDTARFGGCRDACVK